MERLGLLDAETICVHGVHISATEAELLAGRRAGVCLCPGSNRVLGVGRARVDMLLAKGLKPCLGTDSLASNRELNLWREMRILQEDHPGVTPAAIFAMATINGAMAAGHGELGALTPGRAARILAVEFSDLRPDEVYAYLVNSASPALTWLEDPYA
jgi:cytosine/adenosine deaminase-related metal-dependent hydrolase